MISELMWANGFLAYLVGVFIGYKLGHAKAAVEVAHARLELLQQHTVDLAELEAHLDILMDKP